MSAAKNEHTDFWTKNEPDIVCWNENFFFIYLSYKFDGFVSRKASLNENEIKSNVNFTKELKIEMWNTKL